MNVTKPWEQDNCQAMRAHYAVYSIAEAAARWCGVPDEELAKVLEEVTPLSSTGVGRAVWLHPKVPCIEPRCRAINEAIESGELLCGREGGEPVEEHVAYERRHVRGRNLREWMQKAFPNEKPAFLFDDIERASHTSISADAYRALKADYDTCKLRLENAAVEYKKLRTKKDDLERLVQGQQAAIQKMGVPSQRAESTYQRMIAGLLGVIGGDVPGIERHPSIANESALIDTLADYLQGYDGLSKSNLSRKFPEAKRSLKD